MKIYKFRMFRLMVINVLKYMRKLKHYKKKLSFPKASLLGYQDSNLE